MPMIEIVARINVCLFATEWDDSTMFMIIYHHMMKLDILLSGSETEIHISTPEHTLIDLFHLRKIPLSGQ